MKVTFCLVLVGLAATVSASPLITPQFPERIVGGSPATRGEFPWIVQLNVGGQYCAGSIINPTHIVTAAHCCTLAASRYTIVAGEHNLNSNEGSEQTRSVASITRHPSYNSNTQANDICVMKLSSALTLGTYVKVANLPSAGAGVSGNLVAAGWGATSEGGSISNTLLKVTVPFVSQATCNANYGGGILAGMLCAGTGGKDSCQGDSGGPLHQGQTLVGVVSWGVGCARPGYPGVYASMPYYVNWVKGITG